MTTVDGRAGRAEKNFRAFNDDTEQKLHVVHAFIAKEHGDGSKEAKAALKAGIQSQLKTMKEICLLYTSPSPRDQRGSRMPSSA